MTLISYAQNYEDALLWRCFQNVKNGFYIDVGAFHPTIDSVTKIFYDSGWRGINIEPVEAHYQSLVSERPNDLNLKISIGNSKRFQKLYFSNDSGLSTLSEEWANVNNNYDFEEIRSEVTTLSDIWEKHVPDGQEVHFLKIDVEGLELEVIQSNDWDRFRPKVLVVEAFNVTNQAMTHVDQFQLLYNSNYERVYCDGLNYFFVDGDYLELRECFNYPINVFDNVINNNHYRSLVESNLANHHVKLLLDAIDEAEELNSFEFLKNVKHAIKHQK